MVCSPSCKSEIKHINRLGRDSLFWHQRLQATFSCEILIHALKVSVGLAEG